MGGLGVLLTLVASIAAAAIYSHVASTSGIEDPAGLGIAWPNRNKFPQVSNALEKMQRIGEGDFKGAEDMAVDASGTYLYAACSDGWIRRVALLQGGDVADDADVEEWSYVGGRPLGIVAAIGHHESMLVCEPQLGLLNVTKGNVRVLSNEADGTNVKLADGVDIAEDGKVYFTDASTKYGLSEFDLDFLEGRPYGRLLMYDPRTEETTVLLSNLYFPNGVAISSDGNFLLFCETPQARVRKYWLRGSKKGSTEMFMENLPGLPDNIHRNGNVYWVALLGGRSMIWEIAIRMRIVKHWLGKERMVLRYLSNSYARVMSVNEDGVCLQMYESLQSNSIGFMTNGMQIGDYLYVGSLISDYIGKIKLTK